MREDRQRLDKWLWFARFARTRGAAQELVETGRIRLDGRRITSVAYGLKIGDVLTIAAEHHTVVVRVISFATRRGDASSVAAIYEPLKL